MNDRLFAIPAPIPLLHAPTGAINPNTDHHSISLSKNCPFVPNFTSCVLILIHKCLEGLAWLQTLTTF